ncbi:MAG: serine/threonine protein kinase [Planctomycetaceae bacterium]|nr:MAG: serine/threonine protein kinase [Planctomycetaceae bacterium]
MSVWLGNPEKSSLRPIVCCLALAAITSIFVDVSVATSAEPPRDWAHWRGPTLNGHAHMTDLPETWSPRGENLLWRMEEYATRSSPVTMNGRMYVIGRAFPETTQEGEKTICFDPKTGDLIWESIHNVFLSDVPAERVGWSSPVADPETDRVYKLGVGALLQCLEGATGKVVWERSLLEEQGMLSTYGGRTNFPVIFEDLVICSGVHTGWAETALPAHRVLAFDKRDGRLIWSFSTRPRPEDTTYSTPVFAVLNGQEAMVFGGADGSVYAVQPRTGRLIWEYRASSRGISTTALVDENGIVYCGHSEQNASDRTILGALFAFDGNTTGEIAEEDLLWKIPAFAAGRSAPLKIDDRLYAVDNSGLLLVLDAATGKEIARQKIGRIMFASLLYGDGKIYAAESTGRIYVLKPTEKGVETLSQQRLNDGSEIFGSPIAYDGRIYIPTNVALYCIGSAENSSQPTPLPEPQVPDEGENPTQVAHIQVVPAEWMAWSGDKTELSVLAFNAQGKSLGEVEDAEIEIKGGGELADGHFVTPSVDAPTGVYVTAKRGDLESVARFRVVPSLPWSFDFEDGKVPVTWTGAAYRHQPVEFEDGGRGLVKVSTIPKGTRSQSWIGPTDLSNYTVQADFFATGTKAGEPTEAQPNMGVIAQRYALDLQGGQTLQIRSWTSRLELRFAKTIDFPWEPKTWYTIKFQSENVPEGVTLRGKVWPRDQPEPQEWSIEATDLTPNLRGAPGLLGNSTNSEFFIDNVTVFQN